jgi:copper chaperone CopZ
MKTVTFTAGMTCDGCVRAVTKVLGRVGGVDEVQASVEEKSIKVVCDEEVSEEDLFAALQKWSAASGKPVGRA